MRAFISVKSSSRSLARCAVRRSVKAFSARKEAEHVGVVALAQPEPVVDPAVAVGLEDRWGDGGDRRALPGDRRRPRVRSWAG